MRRSADDPSDAPPASKHAARPHRARKPEATRASSAPRALSPGLYIVGTPIGNLGDITKRAADVLASVDAIAAEDTRVARRLLSALGIGAPRLVRYDDHAGEADRVRLIEMLQHGKTVALISDAGMPLVADPGLKLVQAAQAAGLKVTVVPGPSAAVAALAMSGLPSDRFLFQGFLPAKDGARRRTLTELAAIPATLVVFEAPQRLAATLEAMAEVLGGDRDAAVTREITKLFEEVKRGRLRDLAAAYAAADAPKGEIVIVVGPPQATAGAAAVDRAADLERDLAAALATMSLRDAVAAVAASSGRKRGEVYALALRLKDGGDRADE